MLPLQAIQAGNAKSKHDNLGNKNITAKESKKPGNFEFKYAFFSASSSVTRITSTIVTTAVVPSRITNGNGEIDFFGSAGAAIGLCRGAC